MRSNPRFELGKVDTNAALAICDGELPNTPIIYVTPSFETLTGYREREVLGLNCKFLQNPPTTTDAATIEERRKYNEPLCAELRYRIQKGEEVQARLANYRKNGEFFMNVMTIIPITFKDTNSDASETERKYLIGFQIDEREIKGRIR